MESQFNDVALGDDPTAPLRALQPQEVRRRSMLLEKVRKIYALPQRDILLQEAFDEILEDLAERRDFRAPHGSANRRQS